jgi:protein gp37
LRGCRRVSPGCENCYAEKVAHRFSGPGKPFEGLTTERGRWNGSIRLVPEKLGEPLRWRKPRRVFVNSMSDLFHEDVPFEFIAAVFGVMAACPQHTFQILTKRAERMLEWFTSPGVEQQVDRFKHIALAGRISEFFGSERVEAIRGWPGYWITSRGRVMSDRRGDRRSLKPLAGEQGHQRVMLYREGETARPLIHRLVLEHFDRPARAGEQGCHIDGDPSNNALWNLRWGTQADNWRDRERHGNGRSWSKLNDAQVLSIQRLHAKGWPAVAIAERHGISDTQVLNIVKGRQWKEPQRPDWPLHGVWLGVSAEDQTRANERVPALLQCPAAVRFLSAEPLLGPLRLDGWLRGKPSHGPWLDWVIAGGESGAGARPCAMNWIEDIVARCREADVAVFVKQLGSYIVDDYRRDGDGRWAWRAGTEHPKGGDPSEWPESFRVRQFPESR